MLIYEPPAAVDVDQLEDELARAFRSIRRALDEGEAVVVSLDDHYLGGGGEVAQVALAHGLLGLARALAIEGRRAGWHIAVLSSTPEVAPDERLAWIERLGEPGPSYGALVRLGAAHLGRVAV